MARDGSALLARSVYMQRLREVGVWGRGVELGFLQPIPPAGNGARLGS